MAALRPGMHVCIVSEGHRLGGSQLLCGRATRRRHQDGSTSRHPSGIAHTHLFHTGTNWHAVPAAVVPAVGALSRGSDCVEDPLACRASMAPPSRYGLVSATIVPSHCITPGKWGRCGGECHPDKTPTQPDTATGSATNGKLAPTELSRIRVGSNSTKQVESAISPSTNTDAWCNSLCQERSLPGGRSCRKVSMILAASLCARRIMSRK